MERGREQRVTGRAIVVAIMVAVAAALIAPCTVICEARMSTADVLEIMDA